MKEKNKMANFYETVLTVLKSDERFVAEDGTFLRNAVYEAAMKMDEGLIRLLLANDETRTRFFAEVDGVKVFDKMGFAWVVNNRQFLPDTDQGQLADKSIRLYDVSRSSRIGQDSAVEFPLPPDSRAGRPDVRAVPAGVRRV